MRRTTAGLIVTLALSIVVAALATGAPLRAPVPRIGVLSLGSPNATALYFEVFRQSLREMGYAEGQNIALEYRYAEGKAYRLPALAAELVELGVDVIVVWETPAIHAAIQATTTIPIVMSTVGDPVRSGFVKSLARPGGNVTGVGGLIEELNGKLLQLLKEAVPGVTRMAVFVTPGGLALYWTKRWRQRPGRWGCSCNS